MTSEKSKELLAKTDEVLVKKFTKPFKAVLKKEYALEFDSATYSRFTWYLGMLKRCRSQEAEDKYALLLYNTKIVEVTCPRQC